MFLQGTTQETYGNEHWPKGIEIVSYQGQTISIPI